MLISICVSLRGFSPGVGQRRRNEINGNGPLTLPTTQHTAERPTASAYIIQTDPFFARLKAWGNTIWDLWTHNMNQPGAAPVLVIQTVRSYTPTALHLHEFRAQSGESMWTTWALSLVVLGGAILIRWRRRRTS